MNDARRRSSFIAYFEKELKGDRARLMKKTGLTKGRVAQFFDEKQPFGERAARNLATSLHLDPDYFLRDPVQPASTARPQAESFAQDSVLSEEERLLIDAFRMFPHEEHDRRTVTELMMMAKAVRQQTEKALARVGADFDPSSQRGMELPAAPAYTGTERRKRNVPVAEERRKEFFHGQQFQGTPEGGLVKVPARKREHK
jgi:hypothetical protein